MVQKFLLLLIVIIWYKENTGLEICVTKTGKACKCSNDGRIILCNNARIQVFPVFNEFFKLNAEEMHLSHNNISQWPNSTIWNMYMKINYVDVTFNPICTLPVISKHVDIDISPCKYKQYFLHTIKKIVFHAFVTISNQTEFKLYYTKMF